MKLKLSQGLQQEHRQAGGFAHKHDSLWMEIRSFSSPELGANSPENTLRLKTRTDEHIKAHKNQRRWKIRSVIKTRSGNGPKTR
jgi:hypothetical protein